MIPEKERHNAKPQRTAPDGSFMNDEVHFVCQCGYLKAFALDMKGSVEGNGILEYIGDPHADHFYNNKKL